MGSSGAVNSPTRLVLTVRSSTWRSVFVSVILALGISAPEVSVTVPRMVPVVSCAESGAVASRMAAVAKVSEMRSGLGNLAQGEEIRESIFVGSDVEIAAGWGGG